MAILRDEIVQNVIFSGDTFSVSVRDGRTITAPLNWYPNLERATPEQKEKWERCAGGLGIHWPEIDEDISIRHLMEGVSAPPSSFNPA